MNPTSRTSLVRQIAGELGFDHIGISKARRLDEEEDKLADWLRQGHHGDMAWMENNFEKRLDPQKLVPGAKSVVSLVYNYFTDETQKEGAPKISMYAARRDYHRVLKKKLKHLLHRIQEDVGNVQGRCFVDSAPVMERQWAQNGGLGWLGKNTLLIHPKRGSYYFLAELILDLELEPDHAIRDHCGTCRACIDACPTEAIADEGYLLDASRCISYLTIELKDAIPNELAPKMEDWVFGCDICQQVCPWNRFSKENAEDALQPRREILDLNREDWYEMTEDVFDEVFSGTPVKRTKYSGIRRNLKVLSKNQ